MADRLLYRHWTSWKDGRRSHILLFNIQQKTYRDLTPGDFDAPAFSLGGVGFTFSPDGREICFVANRDHNESETTNKDLFVVPAAGGAVVNLTASNSAYDGDPAYSPDGKYIAYRKQTVPGYEADRFRIALLDRATGQSVVLTDGFDNWVNDIQWSPDSRSILFTADVRGHVPLYRVDRTTRSIAPVIDPKAIDAFCHRSGRERSRFHTALGR